MAAPLQSAQPQSVEQLRGVVFAAVDSGFGLQSAMNTVRQTPELRDASQAGTPLLVFAMLKQRREFVRFLLVEMNSNPDQVGNGTKGVAIAGLMSDIELIDMFHSAGADFQGVAAYVEANGKRPDKATVVAHLKDIEARQMEAVLRAQQREGAADIGGQRGPTEVDLAKFGEELRKVMEAAQGMPDEPSKPTPSP